MSGRKKILYVITKSNWGGAQRYVYDLATNLSKDRFEVAVATGRSESSRSEPRSEGAGGDGLLVSKLKEARIKVIPIPNLQRDINFLKELLSFWNLFRIFYKEKPDVIHLNSSKAGGLGAIAAFLYKTIYHIPYTLYPRIIFTVHGWDFNADRPRWQKKIIRFLSWFSSLFQDKIILINKPDLRDAERMIPRHKLELIFNGIGDIDFLPRDEARSLFSQKIGEKIENETVLIGTNAELTKNKGLNYLIDAVGQMKSKLQIHSFQLLIIGAGEERNNLTEQIKLLSLTEKVHLLGFIPDARKYMKGPDIFVLPSIKEGLPYVLLEAMAAKVPIIGTTVGGITDIIDQHETGLFVTTKDIKGLANIMLDLMMDTNLREKLSKNAFRKLGLKFKLQDMIEKTTKLYDQI